MTQRVLLVDDDVNLLQAVKRNLKKQFKSETAKTIICKTCRTSGRDEDPYHLL